MTTKEIQISVQRWLIDRGYIYQVLNYGNSGYYEADVLGVTLSRITAEIEVKISRSDFQADFKKKAKHLRLQKPIQNDHRCTPNRFWYACKCNLIKLHEIPSYAGLIYICDDNAVMIVKDAPLIHKIKANDKLMIGMLKQLTEKSIYDGICKTTHENRIKQLQFEEREAEKKRKTREFIDFALNKKN